MRCLRCGTEAKFVGTKKFREGTNWGILGEMGELFEASEEFDVYICPGCGHAEFFSTTIGRKQRPGPQ